MMHFQRSRIDDLNQATVKGKVQEVKTLLKISKVQPDNGTLLKAYIANNDELISLYKNEYGLAISRKELDEYARENGYFHIVQRLASNPDEGVGVRQDSLRP